ncbi:MAG: hypothetical protein RMJ31_03885 [Nitrososphaerota archaeon]|nr:hypothetical protein [Nitrososphaerota archaeon]
MSEITQKRSVNKEVRREEKDIEDKAIETNKKAIIERSKDFIEKARVWSGQNELASLLAWQLYIKAQAYLEQDDTKNAQKFYNLMMKALKLSQKALERFDLDEFERRLKKLEMQSGES